MILGATATRWGCSLRPSFRCAEGLGLYARQTETSKKPMGPSRYRAGFFRNASGTVAILFAVLSIAAMVFVGAAVDFCRWLNARHQTLAAIDTAVMAAARELQLNPLDVRGALAAAERFYQANVRARLALVSDTVSFRTENNNTAVTAVGSAFLSTTALNLAGVDRLSLLSLSGSEFARAVLSVGPRSATNLEAALVIDISSSMTGQSMTDLKEATNAFVDMIVWPDQSSFTSRVSIVPFSGDVRIPAELISPSRGTLFPSLKSVTVPCGSRAPPGQACALTYRQTPCAAERQGADRYSDVSPGVDRYIVPAYSVSGGCSTSTTGEILPLSNDKARLKARLAGLSAGAGSAAHAGLAWGWYTLSPDWNGLWPAAGSSAARYGSADHAKVAILIADGDFTTEYDGEGLKTSALGAGVAANGASNMQAAAFCAGMKAQGIEIYTIGYGVADGSDVLDVLQGCASGPAQFYRAADGSQLKQALIDVAIRLSSLHLTQ